MRDVLSVWRSEELCNQRERASLMPTLVFTHSAFHQNICITCANKHGGTGDVIPTANGNYMQYASRTLHHFTSDMPFLHTWFVVPYLIWWHADFSLILLLGMFLLAKRSWIALGRLLIAACCGLSWWFIMSLLWSLWGLHRNRADEDPVLLEAVIVSGPWMNRRAASDRRDPGSDRRGPALSLAGR